MTLRERISGQLNAEPRVGGSLYRIANDLRFAKNKQPYKAHLDFSFWQGPHGPRTDPSLLLRITPTGIHLGCGIFGVAGAALDRYRRALRDPTSLAALDAQVTALLRAGAELSEPSRARVPPGFDPASPAARFAVRDGIQVIRRLQRPAAVTSAKLVTWCADRLAPFGPLHAWLVRTQPEDQRQPLPGGHLTKAVRCSACEERWESSAYRHSTDDRGWEQRPGSLRRVAEREPGVVDPYPTGGLSTRRMSASTDETSAQWCWLMLDTMRSNDSSG